MANNHLELVFWNPADNPDLVLFARRDEVEYQVQRLAAMFTSKTWGELRPQLCEGERRLGMFDFFGSEGADRDPFDAKDVLTDHHGDYPEWLRCAQSRLLPEPLIVKYGTTTWSKARTNHILDLPADRAAEIADDLRTIGHTVEEIHFWNWFSRALARRNHGRGWLLSDLVDERERV